MVMDVSDRRSGSGAAGGPGSSGRKIPWEAVVGLGLAAVAIAALMRPSGGAKPAVRESQAVDQAAANPSPSPSQPTASSANDVADELRVTIKPDDVAVFMRAKLDHAQHVIEGLAMEDYQAIYRAAHDLALASQASAWEVLLTEEYARQSADFRRSCEALRTAARDENLDAAALAWMEVTMKCVQCHKYVRQADDE